MPFRMPFKMTYTQRIFWPSYNTEEKLYRLLEFLQSRRALCDEISFFTEGDGQDWRFLPPTEIERRAEFLTEVVRQTRESGFVPVINVLNTMGHGDEGGVLAPVVPWQGIVGTDGATAKQCSCPFDEEFLKYCRFKYQQFARCQADKIWIDDDVRLSYHVPVNWGCFCAPCLADFNARAQREYSRDELLAALGKDKTVRAAWIERNHDVMMGVLRACAEGIQSGAEGKLVEAGFMTCDVAELRDWHADMKDVTHLLSSITGGKAWLRPGGGFWNDATPREVLTKIYRIGNSLNGLPESAGATYEIENYPFIQGGKSAAMTGLECLLATLATKLDGLMFDVLDPAGNDPAAFDEWMGDLKTWRPLWDEASRLVEGTTAIGWRPVYSENHFRNYQGDDLNAMRIISYTQPLALQTAGLPFTAFAAGAHGHMLCGQAARGMSVEEMKSLLEKPLLMDAEAAQCFLDFGLGVEIGIENITAYNEGVSEQFTDHALNGEYSGYRRVATLKYFGLQSFALQTASTTEILSELQDYQGAKLGAALTLHRSPKGVLVAVMGHLPWDFVLSPQRMEQLQNLSDAMMPDVLSVRSNRPVVQWRRREADSGRELTILFNAGFDAAHKLKISGACLSIPALYTPGVCLSKNAEADTLHLPGWSVAVIESA